MTTNTIPEKSFSTAMRNAVKAAAVSTRSYIEEARRLRGFERESRLEAVAVKRALLAGSLAEIAAERMGSDSSAFEVTAKRNNTLTPAQADKRLFLAINRLYRFVHDKSFKSFVDETKRSVGGFGFSSEACRVR